MTTQSNAELIDQLDEQTSKLSSSAQMTAAPAYKALLNIGRAAIPDLLTALDDEKAPHAVMMLLNAITGENPVPKEHRGNTDAMIEDWLEWGEAQ